ncbi:FKBP-type peptidyl-prolyl cis-trans isomerase [Marinibactrum halimedae]|nr:FKBP-type peptidyl-prolyl cis-trans isomerase [Marinibactrum halimedae]
MNLGNQFKRDDIELDIDIMAMALRDAREGKDPRLTEEEMQQAMTQFQEKQRAAKAEAAKAIADANSKEGQDYLTANAGKEGVVTTESGLQYKVITEGSGPKPTPTDTVTVHYRGTLIDGTEFDSSYGRGEPTSFPVNAVIAGWTEALQLMPEGSKWELYIPAELAYGPGGTGGLIGPNATLIFEVELLKASQDKEGEEKKESKEG